MAFLHPNYFPFCPKIGFDGVGGLARTKYQGPFSLEQAMALFWIVGSITISGTQDAPEIQEYSFTWTGQAKMSDTVCPSYLISNPDILQYGWAQNLVRPPMSNFGEVIFCSITDVIYSGGSYYVSFEIILEAEEGAGIVSNSINFNTTSTLQITDDISVPITFRTSFGIYTSEIDSLTCTLRDPS